MKQDHPPRGGAPVGFLTELDPIELASIVYFRLWCEGDHSRAQVRLDFERTLGSADGAQIAQALAQLCDACVEHGRRPLMRHHVTCKCIGGDESSFANFIAAATLGAREDAFLFASNIVRPDIAMCLVGIAQQFGIGLQRMNLGTPDMAGREAGATLH